MTNWDRLTEPFPSEDVEWRIAQAGKKGDRLWAKVLAYITARAIHERLDEVFGPAGWKNEYRSGPNGGVICRIYFKDDAGEWVWREDGAENTEIEAVKGGISGATKRAGAALGIGRYLYHLEEGWANIHENGRHRGKTKDNEWFNWDPPALDAWALPGGAGKPGASANGNGSKAPPETPPREYAATQKQYGLIEKLMKSSVITDTERESLVGRMERGMSKGEASKAIDWLTEEIERRKATATIPPDA